MDDFDGSVILDEGQFADMERAEHEENVKRVCAECFFERVEESNARN